MFAFVARIRRSDAYNIAYSIVDTLKKPEPP
jgi:hypothetical protein